MSKLRENEAHMLRLIANGSKEAGWADVSHALYPLVVKTVHEELVRYKNNGELHKAQLTDEGETVLKWLN